MGQTWNQEKQEPGDGLREGLDERRFTQFGDMAMEEPAPNQPLRVLPHESQGPFLRQALYS